jgi:DNA-binding transcriptional MerR regulator
MKPIQGRMRRLAGKAVLALAALLCAGTLAAQAPQREGFYDIEELRRLLEVARESGFTEQELREITIEDDGGFVKAAREAGFSEEEISRMTADGDPTRLNVWGYLQVIEKRKKLAAEKLKAQREKVYLTVQDIFAEMEKNEPADLTKLRDRIPVKE